MSKNNILITNDDGISSPGIRAAVESVLELGTVTVVAPIPNKQVQDED